MNMPNTINSSQQKLIQVLISIAVVIVIAVATYIAYEPAYTGDFIWDDDTSVYFNKVVTDGENGLSRIWFTRDDYDFWPMTKTMFWIQFHKFGFGGDPANPGDYGNSGGYHKTNVVLHVIASIMVYFCLVRLRIPGAPLAGLIFALHPVNVSSVAWVAELKNPLSMIFLAITLLFYLAGEDRKSRLWYGLSVLAFALALASKTSIAVFPVMLLGLAWWRNGRIEWKDLLKSAPFFALSAAMAVMTVLSQQRYLDVLAQPLPLVYRPAGAGWVLWFYLYKALLPIRLSMIYPHWGKTIEELGFVAFLPSIALAAALAVCWWKRKTWWGRPLLVTLGFCVLAMLPVMGFFNMTFNMHAMVADHFQYLPIIGAISLVCAAGWTLARRVRMEFRVALIALALAATIALGWATRIRADVISDKHELWIDTAEKNPDAWMAHYNLATARSMDVGGPMRQAGRWQDEAGKLERRANSLASQNRHAQADQARRQASNLKRQSALQVREVQASLREIMPHYRRAIELQHLYIRTYNNYGLALKDLGKIEEGIEVIARGIKVDREQYALAKQSHMLLFNHGLLLRQVGRLDEAADAFAASCRLEPENMLPLRQAVVTLKALKRSDEIVQLLEEHVQWREKLLKEQKERFPLDSSFHAELAEAYFNNGQFDPAMEAATQSLKLNPNEFMALRVQGEVLLKRDRSAEAIKSFAKAIQIQQRNKRPIHILLGRLAAAQRKFGNTAAAIQSYQSALKIAPNWAEGVRKLAWIRATHPDSKIRNGATAMKLAERLRKSIGDGHPVAMDVYAAALAENGKYLEAIVAAQRAIKLARKAKADALAEQIEKRVDLYSKGRPYREGK